MIKVTLVNRRPSGVRAIPGRSERIVVRAARRAAAGLTGVLAGLLAGFLVWGTTASGADPQAKIPPAQDIELNSRDGLVIRCTYYVPTLGKKAVPFIMLHGWEGQRTEYDALATLIQSRGHAVLVPDLRGHGASIRFRGTNNVVVERDRMRPADFAKIVQWDLEAMKRFLLERNNAGELNIEQLCIVASGASCPMAMTWSAQDWSWPQLPAYKQGQDVKALVLLSPERSFRGMTIDKALGHPFFRGNLAIKPSIMIIAGANDSTAMQEAKRIHSTFNRFFLDPPPEQAATQQNLFLILPETQLQGTKLLDPRLSLGVESHITMFVDLRLIAKYSDLAWTLRDRGAGAGN